VQHLLNSQVSPLTSSKTTSERLDKAPSSENLRDNVPSQQSRGVHQAMVGQANFRPQVQTAQTTGIKSFSHSKPMLDGSFASRMYQQKGQLFLRAQCAPTPWLLLSQLSLWEKDAPQFFRLYSEHNIEAGKISLLLFHLLDVIHERNNWTVDRNDLDSFTNLKRTIWFSFCRLMIINPNILFFRVLVSVGTGKPDKVPQPSARMHM